MHDLLIQNATLLELGDTPRVLRNQSVAIIGQRISGVGADLGEAKVTINAKGKLLLPGFINTHAHSAMVLFRGAVEDVTPEVWFNEYIWRMETNLTPEDVYWGALWAAVEMLEGGITTVADHYFMSESVARAFLEVGIRADVAPTLFGKPEDLNGARRIFGEWNGAGEGRVRIAVGPHSPYLCSGDFLKQTLGLAQELDTYVHLHVSETARQVEMSLEAHRLTPPAYLHSLGLTESPLLFAHSAHATPADVELMAQHRIGVAHCPKTFLKLASGIAPVTAMQSAGIPVGLGSDGAASNNTMDMLEQLRLAAMLQKHQLNDATALPRHQAVAMLSQEGAKALFRGHELGQIREGYLADLVLVDLEGAHNQPVHDELAALVYSARASDVDTVIVNGKIVMQGRALRTVDKARVLHEIRQRAPQLVRKDTAAKLVDYPT